MQNRENISISSKYTQVTFVGGLVLLPVLLLVMATFIFTGPWDNNVLVFALIMLALVIANILMLVYLAKARFENGNFYFKRFFKPEQQYTPNELYDLGIYHVRRGAYILVTFMRNGVREKYLVTFSSAFYARDKEDGLQVMRQVLANNRAANRLL